MRKAEKYIKDFTKRCSNRLTFGGNAPWVSPENALEAVKIEREELIKEAYKWLKENAPKYHWYDPYEDEEGVRWDDMAKDFKKDMS